MNDPNIFLVPLSDDHCNPFYDWISDKYVIRYSLSSFLEDRNIEWVRNYIRTITSQTDSLYRAIIRETDQKPIGFCGLANISKMNNCAEYFILIGYKTEWNKGFGTKAGFEVLKEGFLEMGLNRIWLTVSECNEGALMSYKKLGFIEEGRMREACFRDGHYHDKIMMSILRSEWQY